MRKVKKNGAKSAVVASLGRSAKRASDVVKRARRRAASARAARVIGGVKPAPSREWRARALDARAKCGPETSVVHLVRVDEVVDRALTAHLVFFDRHGWYCEHGQLCPAVLHAKKLVSQGGQHRDRLN